MSPFSSGGKMARILNNEFNAYSKSVLEILATERNQFLIPYLQRDYDWNWVDNVEVMLNDFSEATNDFEDVENTYLLGMIIASRQVDSDRYLLIDGQQRLTTLSIILYLWHYFIYKNDGNISVNHKEDNPDIFHELLPAARQAYVRGQNDYTIVRESESPDDDTNYRFVEKFVRKIYGEDVRIGKYRKMNNICRGVWDYFEKLTVRDEDGNMIIEKSDKLFNFGRFLNNSARVIFCLCENETQSYTIFELINDRGKKLDKTDLINNHFLRKLGDDEKTKQFFSSKWKQFKDSLEYDHEKNRCLKADDVLRAYIFATCGKKITISNLYSEVKTISQDWNASDIKEFVENLVKATQHLTEVLSSDPGVFSDYEDILLNVLKFKQVWPIIMIGSVTTSEEKRELILNKTFDLCYISVITDERPQYLEKKIGHLLETINNNGKLKPFTDEEEQRFLKIINDIIHEVVSEGVLLRNLQDNKYGSDTMMKILLPINTILCSADSIRIKLDELQVEHILPQSFEDKNIDYERYGFSAKEELVTYIQKIGNATLLFGSDNAWNSDKELAEKKEVFKDSQIELTKLIVEPNSDIETSAQLINMRKKASELLYIKELAEANVMSKDLISLRTKAIYNAIKYILED